MFNRSSLSMVIITCLLIGISITFNTAPLPKSFAQSSEQVTTTAWSPDGTMIATGGTNNFLRISDASGNTLHQYSNFPSGEYQTYTEIVWSPDSSKIAAANSPFIRVWNVNDPDYDAWELIAEFTYGNLTSIAWSPDGTKLAGGSYWDTVNIRIWDAIDFSSQSIASQLTSNVYDLSWNPNNNQITAATTTGILVFPSTLNINPYADPDNHRLGTHRISHAVAWSSDGTKIAAGYAGGTISIWDYATRTELAHLEGHTKDIESLAWSPNNNLLISTSYDGSVRAWSPFTGFQVGTFPENDTITTTIAFSPDGSKIAYGGATDTLTIIDVSAITPPVNRTLPVPIGPTGTITEGFPTYSWWAVPGADWYLIWVSPTPSGAYPFVEDGTWLSAADICAGDICSVHYSGFHYSTFGLHLLNSTYTWRVQSYHSTTGEMSAQNAATTAFTVNAPATPLITQQTISPVIYTPQTATDYQQITLTWEHAESVTYYQLTMGYFSAGTWVQYGWWQNGVSNGLLWYLADDVCNETTCHVTLDYVLVTGASAQQEGRWYVRGFSASGLRSTDNEGWGTGQAFSVHTLNVQPMTTAPTLPETEISVEVEGTAGGFIKQSESICAGFVGCDALPMPIE